MMFRRCGAAMALGVAALIGVSPSLARLAAPVAPYCISVGGGGEGGGYRTTRCEFFDYQACLQAAIGGGNCVQNIDYRGGTPPPEASSRRRR